MSTEDLNAEGISVPAARRRLSTAIAWGTNAMIGLIVGAVASFPDTSSMNVLSSFAYLFATASLGVVSYQSFMARRALLPASCRRDHW